VSILSNPAGLSQITPSQAALIQFAATTGIPQYQALASTLWAVLTPSLNTAVTNLFQTNSGAFPFHVGILEASVRLDHVMHNASLMLRLNMTYDSEQNAHFGGLLGVTRASRTYSPDRTIALQYTRTMPASWNALTRACFSYSRLLYNPNETAGPAIDIAGYESFGRFVPIKDKQITVTGIGEAFNLLNHTNFTTVNNIVANAPLAALPSPLKGIRGNPALPLSFTAAANPRQVQVAVRLEL